MLSLLVSGFWLPTPWAAVALALQGALYAAAVAGYVCQRRGRVVRWLSPPLYFCLGNLAMLAGLLKYCLSRKQLVWERTR